MKMYFVEFSIMGYNIRKVFGYKNLPRPLKPRGPASGSPGRDLGSGSNELKTALPCPSKDLRGPAPGHPGVL